MKKTLKMFAIVMLSIMLIFTFGQPVVSRAAEGDGTVGTIVDGLKDKQNQGADQNLSNISATIFHWIWVISIIVAVIVIMIIGLKFIVGSTQEKAEYKKSLIPLVVGVALVVSATTITKILFGMGG